MKKQIVIKDLLITVTKTVPAIKLYNMDNLNTLIDCVKHNFIEKVYIDMISVSSEESKIIITYKISDKIISYIINRLERDDYVNIIDANINNITSIIIEYINKHIINDGDISCYTIDSELITGIINNNTVNEVTESYQIVNLDYAKFITDTIIKTLDKYTCPIDRFLENRKFNLSKQDFAIMKYLEEISELSQVVHKLQKYVNHKTWRLEDKDEKYSDKDLKKINKIRDNIIEEYAHVTMYTDYIFKTMFPEISFKDNVEKEIDSKNKFFSTFEI